MDISITRYKRCDVIKPVGRVDAYTAPALEEVLAKVTDEERFNIVLDLSDVDFLSSRGLWVLTEVQKRCRRYNRGELVLAGVKNEIRDTLNLAGLDGYFQFFDNVTAAVASF